MEGASGALMTGGFGFEVLADMVASCIGCVIAGHAGVCMPPKAFDAALHALHVASGYDTFLRDGFFACRSDARRVRRFRCSRRIGCVHKASVASAVKFGTCSADRDEQALAQRRAVSALDLAQFVFDDLPKRVVFAVGENRTGEAVCERLEACGATVVRTAARDGAWRGRASARADVVLFCEEQEACVFSRGGKRACVALAEAG